METFFVKGAAFFCSDGGFDVWRTFGVGCFEAGFRYQVHFAVGQGMFQASPLQLAIAYSTIINGGTVPVPHLGQAITDQRGLVQRIEIPPARHVKIDAGWRDAIMRGVY